MPKTGLRPGCSAFSSLCWCTWQWIWQETMARVSADSCCPSGPFIRLSQKEKREVFLWRRLYVQYLNADGDVPCEICVQCVKSETPRQPLVTSTPSMSRFLQTYELWGNEESDWVDLWVKVREVCWALTYLIQTHKTIPKQKWKASDIFYLLYSFSFSRMSYNWQHAVYNFFQSSLFFLITLIQISSISFCDLIISFYYWIIFCYVDVP